MAIRINFTPEQGELSFKDRMEPHILYKTEYEKQQEFHDKLLEDTLILENLKDSEVDADLYREYRDWRDSVESSVDDLNSTGKLNMQNALNLRRDYVNRFKPLEDKFKHRTNLRYQMASEYSPDKIYKKDFYSTPLEDISLEDAVESISLNDIRTEYQKLWSDDFASTELPQGDEIKNNYINTALSSINLEGYSEKDKQRVRDNLSTAYDAAVEKAREYNRAVELDNLNIKDKKKELDSPTNPRVAKGKMLVEDSLSGEKYVVTVDENNNYYDTLGNKIEMPAGTAKDVVIRQHYSKYHKDASTKIAYSNINISAEYDPDLEDVEDSESLLDTDFKNVKKMGTVASSGEITANSYASLSADERNAVEAVLKAKYPSLTVEGLFSHGYAIYIKKSGDTYKVKIKKNEPTR